MNKNTPILFFFMLFLMNNIAHANVLFSKSDFYAITKTAEDLCSESISRGVYIQKLIQLSKLENQTDIDNLIANIASAYGEGSCRHDIFTMLVDLIAEPG